MWIRSSLAVLSALTASMSPAAATPLTHGGSRITAHASDVTPDAGEQFVIRGRYTLEGATGAGHVVKVQTYRRGEWLDIDGARVTAGAEGRYRVRVILSIRGVRDLRVVGVSGGRQHNSYHRLVVEVHGAGVA
jgi:hypothetical protein